MSGHHIEDAEKQRVATKEELARDRLWCDVIIRVLHLSADDVLRVTGEFNRLRPDKPFGTLIAAPAFRGEVPSQFDYHSDGLGHYTKGEAEKAKEMMCESCGYTVIPAIRPPYCPMCGGTKSFAALASPRVSELIRACEAMEKEYLSTEFAGNEHEEYVHILHHVRLVVEALSAYQGKKV